MCVDGMDGAVIKESITKEVDMAIKAEMAGESFWRGIVRYGTGFWYDRDADWSGGRCLQTCLIRQPSALLWAVAMLTTFYGAVLANLIAIPLADKLEIKIDNTKNTRALDY